MYRFFLDEFHHWSFSSIFLGVMSSSINVLDTTFKTEVDLQKFDAFLYVASKLFMFTFVIKLKYLVLFLKFHKPNIRQKIAPLVCYQRHKLRVEDAATTSEAGGLRAARRPPVGPERNHGGGQGLELPEDSEC
jgi:hypothetical protein